MTEVWRPIPSYPGYEASDLGRIKSCERVIVRATRFGEIRQPIRERILKPGRFSDGREFVVLTGQKNRQVHRLVLEAFVGPCPPGMEACHNDGDHTNNRLSNLRWDTRSSNMLDLTRHGVGRWSNKTHCIHGHELTEGNTIRYGPENRWRRCRTCNRRR